MFKYKNLRLENSIALFELEIANFYQNNSVAK